MTTYANDYNELTKFTLGGGAAPTDIKYEVVGRPAFAHVSINLEADQQVVGYFGKMLWMDGSVKLETPICCGAPGGCWAACIRSTCVGASFHQNVFTGPGTVALGGIDLLGDMLPFKTSAEMQWVITLQSFVAGSRNIRTSAKWKGCGMCCCSGEGLNGFLTHVSTTDGQDGFFVAGAYGMIERHDVGAGEYFMVDTGLFFAAPAEVSASIGMAGNLFACCVGGEGLVMKFLGPTTVFTHTHSEAPLRAGLRKQQMAISQGKLARG